MGRAEFKVEHYLCSQVKKMGGVSRKLAWIGRNGAPDRLVMFPGGKLIFVECKALAGKVSRQQTKEIETLTWLGQVAVVVRSKEEVDALLAA